MVGESQFNIFMYLIFECKLQTLLEAVSIHDSVVILSVQMQTYTMHVIHHYLNIKDHPLIYVG